MLNYKGLRTRDYLILQHIKVDRNDSILEIGIGTGTMIEKLSKNVNKYVGIDISESLINYLKKFYSKKNNVVLQVLDVCSNSILDTKFDTIISADTLEHVVLPDNFFLFTSRHLLSGGHAIITYPNESKDSHHGITWFNNKSELLKTIDASGLKVEYMYEVKETKWNVGVRKVLWNFPRAVILKMKNDKNSPQSFEQTYAFQIASTNNIMNILYEIWAIIVTKIISVFDMYKLILVEGEIKNKRLFLCLTK